MKYENKWKPYDLNKDFWEEVLVGRKIVSIDFNKEGIKSINLDNGEIVFIVGDGATIAIEI